MTRYLVTISLGPVQSLIGAARRTRDLWCGSWLLSEASRSAALALHKRHPNCLIFPCPEDPDSALAPRQTHTDAANVSNILRAEVELPDGGAVRELCDAAKNAAERRIKEIGANVRQRIRIREDVWESQIGDILESYAAWVSLDACDGSYGEASSRLGRALAARKATRDFTACPPLPAASGLPKSSLDGALETVLRKADRPAHLQLSPGEQLDALGVIKRLAGDADQFTAYSRIAADPWIEALPQDAKRRIEDAYEPLVEQGETTRTKGNKGIYCSIPYDGQLLYPFRMDNALRWAGSSEALRGSLKRLRGCIRSIPRKFGDPVPYAAILKGDGDRMGAFLSAARDVCAAREISRALDTFASGVPCIVRKHRGHAVYAGGDDVLAIVPLASAVACAASLKEGFAEALEGVGSDDERPTLSVGIGIGHLMEPLGALRERAEQAEADAKGAAGGSAETARNALAIRLGVRSGGEHKWRAQWSDMRAFEDLKQFVQAFGDGKLPSRIAYDIRAIDRRLSWLEPDDPIAPAMRRAEVARALDRAELPGSSRGIAPELRERIEHQAGTLPLAQVSDTLILARWLSARAARDLGETT